VFGIAECGVLTALTLGQRFGIVAMVQNSIPRHLRYLGAMGMLERFAGDVPVNSPSPRWLTTGSLWTV
jgi:allantoin racemase